MEPDLPGLESETFPLDDEEARCLGCLVEKGMTTPDHYPMSLNGVRTACNQVSNRDPIVDYAEHTVERALRRLADKALVRFVHRAGDRVVKYSYALDEVLELDRRSLALVAVLLLRGPQTPGELRQRTMRYIEFTSLPEVESTLEQLCSRRLLDRIDRRPGQKEHRYLERLSLGGPAAGSDAPEPTPTPQPSTAASPIGAPGDEDRITALEEEVTLLRMRLEKLLESLGEDDI